MLYYYYEIICEQCFTEQFGLHVNRNIDGYSES